MRKSKAWMRKGVTIHWAVSSAHRGWSSSHKKRKVLKSVRTSVRPKITLKNVNFSTAIILQNGHWIAVLELRNCVQNTKHKIGFECSGNLSNQFFDAVLLREAINKKKSRFYGHCPYLP